MCLKRVEIPNFEWSLALTDADVQDLIIRLAINYLEPSRAAGETNETQPRQASNPS